MCRSLLLLLPALILSACETAPVVYRTESLNPAEERLQRASMERPGISLPARRSSDTLRTPAPARQLDIYSSHSQVARLHRVIGEVSISTDGRESPQVIREALERQALSRGAQGVIVKDPADRAQAPNLNTGVSNRGVSFEQARVVQVLFIRYDNQRSLESGSPYERFPEP